MAHMNRRTALGTNGSRPYRNPASIPSRLKRSSAQNRTLSNLRLLASSSVITGKPYHAGILLRRHLRPLAAKIGVPRLGWHTFRHSFRSWLDFVGTAVGVQQKMMRHADVTTTMNVYGKAMMDTKLQAHTTLLEYAGVGFCGGAGAAVVEANG